MHTLLSKGRNVNEAINVGLDILQLGRDDVEIEIVQLERKGFLGIGHKPATVKLLHKQKIANQSNKSIEEMVDEFSFNDQTNDQHQDHLAGKVWVEDHKVRVRDSADQYPTVKLSKGIKVLRNGEWVRDRRTVITEQDNIEVHFEEEYVHETQWKISLSKDKMSATIEVTPGYVLNRKLKDQEPSRHLELMLEEDKTTVNSLNFEDVIKELDNKGIKYGIKQSEILNATGVKEPSKIVIAEGLKPLDGENGWLEYKVDINGKKGLEEDGYGRVNFRETQSIPTVEKGEVIAIVHPPKSGIPGITVTNDMIPPKQMNPIKLKSGSGIIEVGNQIVATESGRPAFEQRGLRVRASVVPKLTHRGNVNLSTGNIRFHGDVEIIGEVEENMIVDSEGDIIVHKSTNKANLTTSSSIVVKGNIFNSELAAGKSNMLIVELGHLLGLMYREIERMISYINQIAESSSYQSNQVAFSGLQPLIKILLEKKFKGFVYNVKKYQTVIEKGENYLDKEWTHIAIELKQIFLTLTNQIVTVERLTNLAEQMKDLHEYSQLPVEPDAYITISEASNSSLYCSGDINIIGKGSINNKIHAGGEIDIRGVVRGGELYARLGAFVNEAGANSGTKTVISVADDQQIHINKAYEGVILRVGSRRHVITEMMTNITARADQSGEMIIERLNELKEA